MGTVMFPLLYNRSIPYSWLALKTFLLLYQVLVFVCFVVSWKRNGRLGTSSGS